MSRVCKGGGMQKNQLLTKREKKTWDRILQALQEYLDTFEGGEMLERMENLFAVVTCSGRRGTVTCLSGLAYRRNWGDLTIWDMTVI